VRFVRPSAPLCTGTGSGQATAAFVYSDALDALHCRAAPGLTLSPAHTVWLGRRSTWTVASRRFGFAAAALLFRLLTNPGSGTLQRSLSSNDLPSARASTLLMGWTNRPMQTAQKLGIGGQHRETAPERTMSPLNVRAGVLGLALASYRPRTRYEGCEMQVRLHQPPLKGYSRHALRGIRSAVLQRWCATLRCGLSRGV
jgi:hypothetical protein